MYLGGLWESNVAKPINNRLIENHPLLAFLLIEISTGGKYVGLDFEIYWDQVFVFATPDKGHPNEEGALNDMEVVAPLIREWGFASEPLFRNLPDGDRIDGVRIHL